VRGSNLTKEELYKNRKTVGQRSGLALCQKHRDSEGEEENQRSKKRTYYHHKLLVMDANEIRVKMSKNAFISMNEKHAEESEKGRKGE